jgi:hypothetical protein
MHPEAGASTALHARTRGSAMASRGPGSSGPSSKRRFSHPLRGAFVFLSVPGGGLSCLAPTPGWRAYCRWQNRRRFLACRHLGVMCKKNSGWPSLSYGRRLFRHPKMAKVELREDSRTPCLAYQERAFGLHGAGRSVPGLKIHHARFAMRGASFEVAGARWLSSARARSLLQEIRFATRKMGVRVVQNRAGR